MRARLPRAGSRSYELGFLTTAQAAAEYGVSDTTLRKMRSRGVLTARTPAGLASPVYYRRSELDAAFFGVDKK